ncbi:MAG: PAS domain S-box protein [Chloroflexi bacterium]|nr:PAS domain S-box protein [Chloroflexota bacterium]
MSSHNRTALWFAVGLAGAGLIWHMVVHLAANPWLSQQASGFIAYLLPHALFFVIEGVVLFLVLRAVLARRDDSIQLAEQHQRELDALINSTIDLICRFRPDYTLVFANQTFCATHGQQANTVPGVDLLALMEPDSRPVLRDAVSRALEVPNPVEVETLARSAQGVTRHIQWILQRIDAQDGAEPLLQAVGRDVTLRHYALHELEQHRSRLEDMVDERTRELQAANQRLRELSSVKDDMISNVSHELRSPVTSIKLHAYLLGESPPDPAKHLAIINRETNRLETLVDDLLTFSRLDQEQITPELGTIDLNEVVGGYVNDRMLLAQEAGLALTYEPQSSPLHCHADPDMIGQVVGILLTNALNYTPSKGSVTVRTFRRDLYDRPHAGFAISDTGPGVPREEREHIFSRFFRGSAAHKTNAPGTGLGLSIAQTIVQMHGGRIHLESTPGHGATFTVYLPLT